MTRKGERMNRKQGKWPLALQKQETSPVMHGGDPEWLEPRVGPPWPCSLSAQRLKIKDAEAGRPSGRWMMLYTYHAQNECLCSFLSINTHSHALPEGLHPLALRILRGPASLPHSREQHFSKHGAQTEHSLPWESFRNAYLSLQP